MDKERGIKEHVLALSGKVNLPQGLVNDRSYTIACEVAIKKTSLESNEDGTDSAIYHAAPLGKIVIQNTEGKKLNAEVKTSWSKKLRFAILTEYENSGYDIVDSEIFYGDIMRGIISNINSIVENHIKGIR